MVRPTRFAGAVLLGTVAVLALGGTVRSFAGTAPRARASVSRPLRSRRERTSTESGSDVTADPFTTPAMRSYLATRDGDITVAVDDVTDDKTYLYRPGVAEQEASVEKVDILATFLREHEVADSPLDQEATILTTQMIEDSNDDDATDLWDDEGGSTAVAHFNTLAGLTSTVPNTEGYWGESMTTAADQVQLLKQVVFPNSLLDDASRSYELDLMEHVFPSQRWGVSAGPQPGTTVALKNGWVPIVDGNWQVNSVGYIDGEGRQYLIAVLTNENATEDYGIATIEGLSRLVWSDLAPANAR
jgi:hypothetical protein